MLDGLNDFTILDDTPDVEVSPEAYQDAPTRAPYDPGTYTFKIVKVSLRRDKTGQLRTNNGFPILCLEQVEILEPSERAGDKVFLYQDIRTKPFERKGPKGTTLANQASDLLRALDPTASAKGSLEVLAAINEMTEAGAAIFKGRLDWQAYDSDYVNDEFERQGGKDVVPADMSHLIYNTGRVRGWRQIRKQNASRNGGELGGPTHQWFGPSGAVIDAQVEISRFYAQDSKEKVGPDREFRIGG